jgi:hypothetical protein
MPFSLGFVSEPSKTMLWMQSTSDSDTNASEICELCFDSDWDRDFPGKNLFAFWGNVYSRSLCRSFYHKNLWLLSKGDLIDNSQRCIHYGTCNMGPIWSEASNLEFWTASLTRLSMPELSNPGSMCTHLIIMQFFMIILVPVYLSSLDSSLGIRLDPQQNNTVLATKLLFVL